MNLFFEEWKSRALIWYIGWKGLALNSSIVYQTTYSAIGVYQFGGATQQYDSKFVTLCAYGKWTTIYFQTKYVQPCDFQKRVPN